MSSGVVNMLLAWGFVLGGDAWAGWWERAVCEHGKFPAWLFCRAGNGRGCYWMAGRMYAFQISRAT
jgi:hypothetical protein